MLPTPSSGIATFAPPSGCPAVDVTRPEITAFCAAATLDATMIVASAASAERALRKVNAPPMADLTEAWDEATRCWGTEHTTATASCSCPTDLRYWVGPPPC